MQYCSLQYQTWLPSPVTSTAGGCFCFGFVSSFFLELFLHSSSSILCTYQPVEFYLFAFSYCSWSCQGKSTGGLPFPSPVDHVLSELSTMTHPYWVALYSMAHSFTELDNRRRQWQPTPVLLPGKSHGWRSLEGCSPCGRWGSDTTEQLHFHALEKEMATHSSAFAWRIPVGCCLWGRTESDTPEVT